MKNREQTLTLAIIAKIRTHTAANPIKSKTIEQLYSITGEKVREIVHDARMAGHPIGSGSDGYFECRTFNEWKPTREHLRGRAMSMLDMVANVDRRFEGEQQGIF